MTPRDRSVKRRVRGQVALQSVGAKGGKSLGLKINFKVLGQVGNPRTI